MLSVRKYKYIKWMGEMPLFSELGFLFLLSSWPRDNHSATQIHFPVQPKTISIHFCSIWFYVGLSFFIFLFFFGQEKWFLPFACVGWSLIKLLILWIMMKTFCFWLFGCHCFKQQSFYYILLFYYSALQKNKEVETKPTNHAVAIILFACSQQASCWLMNYYMFRWTSFIDKSS